MDRQTHVKMTHIFGPHILIPHNYAPFVLREDDKALVLSLRIQEITQVDDAHDVSGQVQSVQETDGTEESHEKLKLFVISPGVQNVYVFSSGRCSFFCRLERACTCLRFRTETVVSCRKRAPDDLSLGQFT